MSTPLKEKVKTEQCATCGEILEGSRCDYMEKIYGADYERICAMCRKRRSEGRTIDMEWN